MIFIFISLFVPVLTYVATQDLLERATGKRPVNNGLLTLACTLFFISWYLPSPLIEGKHTAFTTHLLGGGLFSGVLWLYIKEGVNGKKSWFFEFVSLYAFVSALGVANELFELFIVKVGVSNLALTDTSWDLAANTLGMTLFWVIYKACGLFTRSE